MNSGGGELTGMSRQIVFEEDSVDSNSIYHPDVEVTAASYGVSQSLTSLERRLRALLEVAGMSLDNFAKSLIIP